MRGTDPINHILSGTGFSVGVVEPRVSCPIPPMLHGVKTQRECLLRVNHGPAPA